MHVGIFEELVQDHDLHTRLIRVNTLNAEKHGASGIDQILQKNLLERMKKPHPLQSDPLIAISGIFIHFSPPFQTSPLIALS